MKPKKLSLDAYFANLGWTNKETFDLEHEPDDIFDVFPEKKGGTLSFSFDCETLKQATDRSH